MPDHKAIDYPLLGRLYDLATGDEDARVCKEIPDASCRHQPRNFFAYLIANIFTKVADELCSARLIFPWLIGSLGAPAVFAGFLVPVREAGVLLPQLVIAAYIRRIAVRKWVWIAGGLLSASAMAAVTLAVPSVRGTTAGWLIIALLSVYSLARGICSVSAKDVVGKTISKTRRGTLMGWSASISGLLTLFIGIAIGLRNPDNTDGDFFVLLLASSAIAYVLSALCFAWIREVPGATEGGGNALASALSSLGIVITDSHFRHFVIARTLLLSIALAPPFYVLLAQRSGVDLSGLGVLIIASGLASMVSAPLWGRMSDRSSRRVMAVTALLSGLMGVTVFSLELAGLYQFSGKWQITGLFFLIAVFHGGARLGRKTYLVDMANQDNRATYVAVSNTLIGLFMLAGGAIGIVADRFSVTTVIGLLGVISLLAALYCWRIREVSGT